jgi:hypothetical protein
MGSPRVARRPVGPVAYVPITAMCPGGAADEPAREGSEGSSTSRIKERL